jgi:hypothetical protein
VPLEDALLDLAEQLDHAADMIIAALINNVRRRGDRLVPVLSGLAAASGVAVASCLLSGA